jgi:hypothetical protein
MSTSTVKRSVFSAAILALAMSGFAQAAHAAPTLDNAQGRTEQGNGRSICYFSGLNDDPFEEGGEGRVQSFGQIVKQFGPLGGIPGVECNPNKGYDLKPR